MSIGVNCAPERQPGGGPRALVLVQVLDPRERDLTFKGKVRLKAIEGDTIVVTDADAVRAEYRERLEAHTEKCRRAVEAEGGRLVSATTTDDAVSVVRPTPPARRAKVAPAQSATADFRSLRWR